MATSDVSQVEAHRRSWLLSRAVWVLLVFPRFLINATTAKSDFLVIRPWLNDSLRARIVGWSNLGAVSVGLLNYILLHDLYTPRVGWWMAGIGMGVLAMTVAAFAVASGTGPSTDWDRALGETEPGVRPPPRETAAWLRLFALLTMVWVGLLVHWTGGPILSPFAAFGVLLVVLGQFVAGTLESHVVLAALGCVLYAILIVTEGSEAAEIFRHGANPLTDMRFRAAHGLVIAVGYYIGVTVNVRIKEPNRQR